MREEATVANQSQIGANILKRTIEYLCTNQWTEDRADALEIVNLALEKCFADESSDEHKRIARIRANANRKAREQVMRDCGLVKVRGALGGIYWE